MKKIIKHLFLFAAVAGFASCSDEEAADMSIEGIKGDFAYIVGANEAMYQATNCEVFHTPDLEDGTVEMSITVALTRAQQSNTTVVLEIDNAKVGEGYEPVPDGVVSFEREVIVPAGETKTTISLSIAPADFPKLVQPLYMVPVSIVRANNVGISTMSNTAILIVMTETIDPADNIINVKESVTTYTVKNYTNETTGDTIEATISISGSEPAYKGFDITLGVDNSLIAEYNRINGTAYVALPANVTLNLSSPEMATDATSASASVSIADSDRPKLTDGKGYLVPVVVKDASPATIASDCGVTYLAIDVLNFDTPSDFFYSLYLGDYRMATWYQFQRPIDLSEGYTYVFHVFIDEVTDRARIGDFADLSENWINMLRFGQRGNKDTRLEWWVGPNGCRKNLYTSAFDAKRWYQVGLVYTGSEYQLYVEGELQDSYVLTESDLASMSNQPGASFQAIEFNSSWGANYRNGNEFHGRLWQMAIFPLALDSNDLTSYCYHGYPDWLISRYAAAYWPFDDGMGAVCAEASGKYESIDFTKTIRCDDESSMVPADVSEYVQWVADEYNKFD